MRGVLLASLRHHTRRYLAAGIAVVIGVAFVVVTGMLTQAAREGLTADVGAPVAAVDHVVTLDDQREVAALVRSGEPVLTLGYAMEPVFRDGVQLTDSADVAEVSLDPALQWQELEDGRYPTSPGEGLADVNAAKSNDVALGDLVTVGRGDTATEVEVVGMVDSPVAAGAALYVPWETLQGFSDSLWVDALAWGGSVDQARELAPSATVVAASDWVAERQAEIVRGVDVLAIVALLFVAIALVVGVIVIANTFGILLAQRTRDFALLRCVGVTRRQLRRAVRFEALLIGVVSSVVGVVGGLLAGAGLVVLVRRWFDDMGPASVPVTWTLAAVAVGLVVTLTAAWLPTRAATKVAPLAALRPDTGVDVRSAAGRVRIALAVLALVGGTGVLALAVATRTLPVMVVGGTTVFLGVLLIGPLLVPGLVSLAGRFPTGGPVWRLASSNAVRNPRRTATTAASLLVGVTLTTAVLTGLASSRTALDREMDASYPLDGTITAVDGGLDPEVADRARGFAGVEEVDALDGTLVTVGDAELPLVAVDDRPATVRGPDDLVPRDGTVLLSYDALEVLPRKITNQVWNRSQLDVVVDGRTTTLAVETGSGWGTSGIVTSATLADLDPTPVTTALWVLARPGADAQDLTGDLAALAGAAGASVDGGYANRQWVGLQVDVLTGAVVGLLTVAVVIALVGIANTLGLSVLERGRENALLRALGLTRRQLRRALAAEGLLLSGVATVMGTAIGLAFAWVAIQVMVADVIDDSSMTIPFAQLAVVAAVAAVAGLGASVLPARRAARVAPAAGLSA